VKEIVRSNTPIESYQLGGREVFVKREDLCCPAPGPAFSKIRGVYSYLKRMKAGGSFFPLTHVGAVDTLHSKAGWGVAYVCKELDIPCTVYFPRFIAEAEGTVREYQQKAEGFGAELHPMKATMSAVLWNQACAHFRGKFGPGGLFLPNGLKLQETVDETWAEVEKVPEDFFHDTMWVVSVSSGTIGAALLRVLYGAPDGANVGLTIHMGYDRSEDKLLSYMRAMSGRPALPRGYNLVNEHYEYADKVEEPCPFPCNPYYDLKAWKWLRGTLDLGSFSGYKRILFWNIGE
jgi:1-aminocyclopropane-1-carboxylate deaminase/D-cysteine desulfhydrase-like pyridoxal-dependent ACC family enzyme